VTVVVIGGLLGAVALGALAGARRTASAYDRYLASINISDAFVNVPGKPPGVPVTEPIREEASGAAAGPTLGQPPKSVPW
jgi:hypothetical protein